MLLCRKCSNWKAEADFHKCSARKTGRQFYCRSCDAADKLRRYHEKAANEPEAKARKAEYDRKRRAEKREQLAAYDRLRSKSEARKELRRRRVRSRKAGIGFATPKWLSRSQKADIRAVYKMAARLQALFGVEYHVDHIVPLRGSEVCGLHVPWNLQILEKSLNKAKSNKLNRKQYP